MATPLIPFTIAWLLGIWLASRIALPTLALGIAIPVAIFGMILTWRSPKPRWTFIFVLAATLGALRYNLAQPHLGQISLATYNDQQKSVIVEGVVVGEPDSRDAYTNLRVEADKLIIADQPTRTVKGLVLVQAPPFTDFRYGDRIRAEGTRSVQTPTDPPDFSYREYQVQEVSVGDGTAFLWLHYAASNAPLELHTDAMRIELLAGSGGAALGSATVVTSVILPFDKWWLRPEGRTLTIDALATRSEEPGALSLPVPLTITLSQNQVITGFAPSTIVVPMTTLVMVQTSSRYNMGKDTAIFDLWTADGVGAGLAPSTMITVTDNIALTAHYAISEKQQVYLPLVIR